MGLAGLAVSEPLEDSDALLEGQKSSRQDNAKADTQETDEADEAVKDDAVAGNLSDSEIAERLAKRLKEIEQEVEFSSSSLSDSEDDTISNKFDDFKIISPFDRDVMVDYPKDAAETVIIKDGLPTIGSFSDDADRKNKELDHELKGLVDSITEKPKKKDKKSK